MHVAACRKHMPRNIVRTQCILIGSDCVALLTFAQPGSMTLTQRDGTSAPAPGKTGSAPSADPAAALSPRTVWKKVRCHNRSIRYTSPADMAEKRMARTKRMRWAIFIQIRRERCTHHAVMMCVCLCIRNLSDERTVFLMLALLLLPCRLLVRCCRAFHIYVACGRCSA